MEDVRRDLRARLVQDVGQGRRLYAFGDLRRLFGRQVVQDVGGALGRDAFQQVFTSVARQVDQYVALVRRVKRVE